MQVIICNNSEIKIYVLCFKTNFYTKEGPIPPIVSLKLELFNLWMSVYTI